MSIYAIQNYHKELEKIIHYGGLKKETAIRNAFYYLLNMDRLNDNGIITLITNRSFIEGKRNLVTQS
jgi:predicted helicase